MLSMREGALGGIIVFWDSRVLQLVGMEELDFWISCRFKTCEDHFFGMFIGYYGPSTNGRREGLWEELGAIRAMALARVNSYGFGTL